MHIREAAIYGKCSGAESVKQAVFKILNTEKETYIIYSDDYGIKLDDLMGKNIAFVKAELPHRITEALLHDDRIISVEDFSFECPKRHNLICRFTVNSIFGSFEERKEMRI